MNKYNKRDNDTDLADLERELGELSPEPIKEEENFTNMYRVTKKNIKKDPKAQNYFKKTKD